MFAWGPYISQNSAFTASDDSGATLLDVAVGHFLDCFTHVLGPFASISATLENQYPTAQLVDETGKPTGRTTEQTAANQVAIVGQLKDGAVVSLHWRGGLESKAGKAGTPFVWTIDGDKGSIRLESDDASGSFIHIRDPVLYVDGEEVKTDGGNGLTNPGRAWAEFAKGSGGAYATLDDALKLKVVLDAIRRSARDGQRVYL